MKVAVLMGGTSSEREISLRTGRGMAQAVRRLGHDVLAVDAANGRLLPPGDEERAAPLEAVEVAGPAALVKADALRAADVILIALHGGAGENGTLQALLDLAGKAYTGSGVMASAVAMNKAMSKRLFVAADVPTPAWVLMQTEDEAARRLRRGEVAPAIAALGWPLVAKPNEEGSTVGLTIVAKPADLPAAFDLAAKFGHEVLLEAFIAGRELTVAVMGDQPLPIVEIRPKSGFYDYESKYTAGRSEYFCPADLPDATTREVQRLGVRAAEALDCRGVTRTDFRLDDAGIAWCLEVNTIPGMTPTSLVPMAAKAAGMTYEQVVQRMLDLALEETRRRRLAVPSQS
ncbi:MAG: D-alanine--D-alanine ligase [Candidatus Eisenbacteria bacterium]|uniref:D-alanine--D-alanine ligase n=1 Tax=Eiseniibacteriota bacterium TaxID=2212470 RepID=A0A9D6L993_UNCEI|nr:D-alanine--D-alanine ligase [Candidatus Eisenbacteria bacterium]